MENLDFLAENKLIRRRSYRYIFPPMVGMIFAQMAPVVDGIVASGGMGEEALSAIGVVGPMDYIFNLICALFGIGCGVVISRCSGAGEKAKAARVFSRTVILMVSVALILMALAFIFMEPLLKLFCATPENIGYARTYLAVILSGGVFMTLNFAGDYILANDNNETLAVTGDIVGAIVNIIIDFVGVYVFHQGVWVVGFGTVAGSFCCVLVYLLHFRKKDRLCRFVKPERKEGDPSMLEIIKPGSAEGLMYFLFTVQLIVQNYVLRDDGGTSGLANSTIIENLMIVFTIVIAGSSDAIFPMASAYHGEQNKSGMLMVKRSLTKTGFYMLVIPVLILCVFPQLMILPYKVDDPVMLESLPFAIRLVSINQLLVFLDTILIDYLSATEKEKKANRAFIIQFLFQVPLTMILNIWSNMNSAWYASIIAQVAVLIYLGFFCDDLPRGMRSFHRENLLMLKGGSITPAFVTGIEEEAEKSIGRRRFDTLKQKMLLPVMQVLSEESAPSGTFSLLKRDDNRVAAVLHYEAKKDLLEDLPEIELDDEDEGEGEEVPFDSCIRSEFLGMRRVMMILSDTDDEKTAEEKAV